MPKLFILVMIIATNVMGALPQKPLMGTKSLTCLGIKYPDIQRFASQGECNTLVHSIAEFYATNTRGNFHFTPVSAYMVEVPYNGNPKNVYKAESFAVGKHPGSDFYAVVGMFYGASHAGDGIAHLNGLLIRDGEHEVGHLVGLGHAGAYKRVNGKMVLDQYADGTSVMGRFPAPGFTAPQYFYIKATPDSEVAMYEAGKTYTIKRVNDFKSNSTSVVIVPPEVFRSPNESVEAKKNGQPARAAFISFPIKCDSCLTLHLSNGGSSQRVKVFGSEYYDEDFTGLHIKKTGAADGRVSLTVDFAAKPEQFVEDVSLDNLYNDN